MESPLPGGFQPPRRALKQPLPLTSGRLFPSGLCFSSGQGSGRLWPGSGEGLGPLSRADFLELLTCTAEAGRALKLRCQRGAKDRGFEGPARERGAPPPTLGFQPSLPAPRLFTQPLSFQSQPHRALHTSVTYETLKFVATAARAASTGRGGVKVRFLPQFPTPTPPLGLHCLGTCPAPEAEAGATRDGRLVQGRVRAPGPVGASCGRNKMQRAAWAAGVMEGTPGPLRSRPGGRRFQALTERGAAPSGRLSSGRALTSAAARRGR